MMKNPRALNTLINVQIINKNKIFYQTFSLILQNNVNEMQNNIKITINITIKSNNNNLSKSNLTVPSNIKLIV